MSGAALVAMPGSGDLAIWLVAAAGQPPHPVRRDWSWRIGVFCLGLLATAGGAAVVWQHARPITVIRTRIVAEGATELAGRAALSDVALRLAATSAYVSLPDGGQALDITVQDPDPGEAEQRSRSIVDALLNAPVAVPPLAVPPASTSPEPGVRAKRARLALTSDAAEAHAMAISAALTGLARDAAAASRSAAEHKPGRETLEKGEAALADLQLQRLQLVGKYQDTYPAVLALDGQIRNLHVFLVDEARRIETRPLTATPADALLTGERDRLRAELAQLDDRRRGLAIQSAQLDQQLASHPPTPPFEAPPPVSPPVLVAAATTGFAGPDSRPAVVAAILGAGLFLSGLLAMLTRRNARPLPHRLVLDPRAGHLLAADQTLVLPACVAEAALCLPMPQTSRLHRS